jgi:hypothetical protein
MTFKEYGLKQNKVELKDVAIAILDLEYTLIDLVDAEKAMDELGKVFSLLFGYANTKSIDITSSGVLEYWRLNSKNYKMTQESKTSQSYLYTLRTSLKNLYKEENENNNLFDMVLKTMLYIDSLNWSLDIILANSLPIEAPKEGDLIVPPKKKSKKIA